MKKVLAVMLWMVLLCSLAACAVKVVSPQETDSAPKTQTQQPSDIPPAQETPSDTPADSAQTSLEDEAKQPEPEPIDYTVFCGNYSDTETVEGPCYTVSILSVDPNSGAIEFTISYIGTHSSPIYSTEPIHASVLEDGTVQFEWTDSWKNQGNGTLMLNSEDESTVQLKMTVTEEAEVNRATLSTHGQVKTLTRRQAQ